jgi:hypothetical protein
MINVETAMMGSGAVLVAASFDTGFIWDALVSYGPVVMAWGLGLLALAGTWVLTRLGAARAVAAAFSGLGMHARDVVLEVFQTYVEGIKAGRADGELTPMEREVARRSALAKLKLRLTWRQLVQLSGGLLSRIAAGSKWQEKVEEILGGAIETAVAESKRDAKAAGIHTSGKAVALPVPKIQDSPIPPGEAPAGPPVSPR